MYKRNKKNAVSGKLRPSKSGNSASLSFTPYYSSSFPDGRGLPSCSLNFRVGERGDRFPGTFLENTQHFVKHGLAFGGVWCVW